MKPLKARAWDGERMHYPTCFSFDYSGDKQRISFQPDHLNGGTFVTDEFQFSTGLQDKHGKDIFEGDLLEESPGYIFHAVWDESYCKFRLQHGAKAIQYPEWNRGKRMSIVGNIYESPELMEAE